MVMNTRKEKGLQPSDRVRVSVATDADMVEAVKEKEHEVIRDLKAESLDVSVGEGEPVVSIELV
jgi:hypothetical protein